MKKILEIAAAQYALGLLEGSDLPKIANEVISEAVDVSSVAQLATEQNPIMSEVGPLFEDILKELRIPIPSPREAIWTTLRYSIGRIANREVSPREALRQVHRIYEVGGLQELSKEYAGDSHSIQRLYGNFWSYDDIEARPDEVSFQGMFGDAAVKALDEDCIKLAGVWLAKYAK